MKVDNYYIVIPKKSLLTRFEDSDLIDLFTPQLWLKDEPVATFPEYNITQFKLFYLADLITEDINDPRWHEFFGNMPISIEEFDKWWTLIRISGEDGDYYERIFYSEDVLSRIKKTDNPLINQWIDSLWDKL